MYRVKKGVYRNIYIYTYICKYAYIHRVNNGASNQKDNENEMETAKSCSILYTTSAKEKYGNLLNIIPTES